MGYTFSDKYDTIIPLELSKHTIAKVTTQALIKSVPHFSEGRGEFTYSLNVTSDTNRHFSDY